MIRRDTEKLSLPEGRRVGQPGHKIARNYLKDRMKEIGLIPFKNNNFCLPYRDQFANLAGVIPGRNSSALPVLIGAHYDSAIDAPCADDNAISVALILSISEILMKKSPERSTIIAFFDAEEKPFFLTENMGSTRFCNDHCNDIDFACVVILDMIGHDFQVGAVDLCIPGIRQMLFILGSESHPELPAIVENASSEAKGLRVIPTLTKYIGDRSDYHAFRKAGQPFLFISKGWGKHSHTPEDTVDWINFSRVEKVQDLLLNILKLLDHAPVKQMKAEADPFSYEIRMMKKAIGWPLPLILGWLGFFRFTLRSRKDIDSLMAKILKLAKF